MRLAVLIVLGVAVLVGAVASYYHYHAWRENRYDDFIVEAANDHQVDPALVKALYKAQQDLGFSDTDSKGLLLVPPRVANAYLQAKGRTSWRYICPNRHFRNHDGNKPEQFTSDKRGRCNVPGCGQPLVEELLDPATNIEVVCWSLSEARRAVEETGARHSPEELRRLLVIAYRWGFPTRRTPITLTPDQKTFLDYIEKVYPQYLDYFSKRARRARRNK